MEPAQYDFELVAVRKLRERRAKQSRLRCSFCSSSGLLGPWEAAAEFARDAALERTDDRA